MQAGYISVGARRLGLSRQRGGIRAWQSTRRDILRHLKENPGAIHTTMVDYYALPPDWPGRGKAPSMNSTSQKAECVEEALLVDIAYEMGPKFNAEHFVPFVMMHEFEALLFSNSDRFAQGIERLDLATKFIDIRQEFTTPEDINDSADTAPSKRIMKSFPGYEKAFSGPLAAIAIGLSTIRNECLHFNSWLERLESLASQP
jgi:hypothetical protein